MSFERPWLTFFVSGTTVMVASNVIYFVYRKLFAKKATRNRWFSAQSNKPGAEISGSRKRRKVECRNRTEGEVTDEEEAERQLELRKPSNLWNTVIFFPDPSSRDGLRPSRDALLGYLRAAQTSIQICMYLTSSPQFVNIIREKYNQGLMVQVVTDYDTYTAHNNFGPKTWKRCGIEVRMKCTGFLMHHKFVIIDEEAILTGSLNWTKQGMSWNQENVMVSTHKNIVAKYMEEFYLLWRMLGDER